MSTSAFPVHGTMGEVVQEGMTLRDYFAAASITSTIKMLKYDEAILNAENIAITAYQIADAMMLEREAKEPWRKA